MKVFNALMWVAAAGIVVAMLRWLIAFWRYTPVETPRAPGLRRSHRRVS